MEISSENERVVVDYITLDGKEALTLRDMLIRIAEREDPEAMKKLKFIGYEQGFLPETITIESQKFTWEFKVRFKPTESLS